MKPYRRDRARTLFVCLLALGLGFQSLPAEGQSDPETLSVLLGLEPEDWPAYCADTLPDGSSAAPPRPIWSSLEGKHRDQKGDRLPSYRQLSENFSLQQSLQFLISTLTNLIDKIEKAEDQVDKVDIDGKDFGIPNLGIVPQARVGLRRA